MRKTPKKAGVGKVVAGVLVGGVVGATLGWLTAPASGEAIGHPFKRDKVPAQEKAKSAKRNLESRFRDLAEEAGEPVARSTSGKR